MLDRLMPLSVHSPSRQQRVLAALLSALSVGAVGLLDYFTGVEYRVFPLYFLPLSFGAWYLGRGNALLMSALCTAAWVTSNSLAGLSYSSAAVWAVNALMQAVAFTMVALLIAILRELAGREAEHGRTDALTRLPNRRDFYQEAERLLSLARRHRRPVTLAYLDLDRFKALNDRLGHHAGDVVLQRVADVLRAHIRASDLPGRLGGDEFVLFLPETGADGARTVLGRLHQALTEDLERAGGLVAVSIGAVSLASAPDEVEALIQRADAAMYAAKSDGGSRLRLERDGGDAETILAAAYAGSS
jgi:diguanylate cyclase (GGDEF)-like protein